MLQVQYSGLNPGGAGLNHFTGHPLFQFTDTTLSDLLPRGVGFSLSCVTTALQSFLLKSPLHCSFEPSNTMVGGTLSQWNNRDKVS
jgi:hypothetical protein